MSDVGKMTEKFRRPNFGILEIELTIDDPKVYTRPFTVNLTQSLEADTELVDEFCLEGEKDYDRLQRSRGNEEGRRLNRIAGRVLQGNASRRTRSRAARWCGPRMRDRVVPRAEVAPGSSRDPAAVERRYVDGGGGT